MLLWQPHLLLFLTLLVAVTENLSPHQSWPLTFLPENLHTELKDLGNLQVLLLFPPSHPPYPQGGLHSDLNTDVYLGSQRTLTATNPMQQDQQLTWVLTCSWGRWLTPAPVKALPKVGFCASLTSCLNPQFQGKKPQQAPNSPSFPESPWSSKMKSMFASEKEFISCYCQL